MVGSLSDIFTQDLEALEPDDIESEGSASSRESRKEAAKQERRTDAKAENAGPREASKEFIRAVYSMGKAAGLSDAILRELLASIGLSTTKGMSQAKLEDWKLLKVEQSKSEVTEMSKQS